MIALRSAVRPGRQRRVDHRHRRLPDHLRPGGVRRDRGRLEGAEHPAHPAHVGLERHPRHRPGRRADRSWARPTGRPQVVLGFLAVFLATLNVVGGFVVTDRMLEMFKAKPGDRARAQAAEAPAATAEDAGPGEPSGGAA